MTDDGKAVTGYLDDLRQRQRAAWPVEVPAGVDYPLGEITITDHLRHRARHDPERTAIVFYGTEISYADLDELSDRFAGWLDSVGVRPGDRVGVHLPNCPQFVIAMTGVLKLGAVHVPVNPLFREHELRHELQDAGIEVAVTLDALAPTVQSARSQTPLRELLVTALADMLPVEPALPVPPAPSSDLPPSDWSRVLEQPRFARVDEDLDALAALNYTGGTTGLPKGCEHTQRHMLYTAVTMAAAQGVSEGVTNLVYIPIFWIAGEDSGILIPIVTGGTCVLLTRWDPDAVLTAVERYRVRNMVGTVDNYVELLDRPEIGSRDLSSLDRPLAVSFVRKLTPQIRQHWREVAGGHSVLREAAYGMTETHTGDTSPLGFQRDDHDLTTDPVFCGLPVPGTDVMVVSHDTGEPLALGRHGEIVVRSPSVMNGYWRNPDATAEVLRHGWLHTGDVGMLDEDGCLHYLGRNKEMIKVNGMSVFPAELEMLLGRKAGIAAVGVVAVDDPAKGQVPLAFVQPEPGAELAPTELRAWAHENMAAYKVPLVRIVEQLPMTATGKIKKGELLEQAGAHAVTE